MSSLVGWSCSYLLEFKDQEKWFYSPDGEVHEGAKAMIENWVSITEEQAKGLLPEESIHRNKDGVIVSGPDANDRFLAIYLHDLEWYAVVGRSSSK